MPEKLTGLSPYRAWEEVQWKTRRRSYRNLSDGKKAGGPLHTLHICFSHFDSHHRGCMARKLQRGLKKLGYVAGQYQGYVTTDAPREVTSEVLAT